MGQYQTVEEIEDRIEYVGDDFFTSNADPSFDTLVTTLEAESRALIESYKGDIQFDKETDKEVVKQSPDGASLQLQFPIQSISKVEYKRTPSDSWNELDSDRYYSTKHSLVLSSYPAIYKTEHYGNKDANILTNNSNRLSWMDFSQRLRITYTRGYDEVPANIKNIQIALINKMLRQLRNEQVTEALSPDQVRNFDMNFDTLMTEDIRERLDEITSHGNKVIAI